MVKHARDDKDKEARRTAILAAASRLFLHAPDKLPSAAMIAEAAGLAKGTVYLYFRTKEAIFMALLQRERAGLLRWIDAVFTPGQRSMDARITDFIDGYCDYLMAHPEMLKLDALGYSVLERNLEPALLIDYKLDLIASLTRAGQLLESALCLPEGRGLRLLVHTHALTCGLWQALDYPENCRELMQSGQLQTLEMDFRTELHAALTQYWSGLPRAQASP